MTFLNKIIVLKDVIRMYAGIWYVISVEWNVESVTVVNTAGVTGRVTLFLTTGMSRFFAKLGLNSTSCGLLNRLPRDLVRFSDRLEPSKQ